MTTILMPKLQCRRQTQKRIVIAHGDHDFVEYLVYGLHQAGFLVDSEEDGISCISNLRINSPDVLLLDSNLLWGGGDGVLSIMESDALMKMVPVMVLAPSPSATTLYRIRRFSVADIFFMPMRVEAVAVRCSELTDRFDQELFGGSNASHVTTHLTNRME